MAGRLHGIAIGPLRVLLRKIDGKWYAGALEIDCELMAHDDGVDKHREIKEKFVTKLKEVVATVATKKLRIKPGESGLWAMLYQAALDDKIIRAESVKFWFPEELPFTGIVFYELSIENS